MKMWPFLTQQLYVLPKMICPLTAISWTAIKGIFLPHAQCSWDGLQTMIKALRKVSECPPTYNTEFPFQIHMKELQTKTFKKLWAAGHYVYNIMSKQSKRKRGQCIMYSKSNGCVIHYPLPWEWRIFYWVGSITVRVHFVSHFVDTMRQQLIRHSWNSSSLGN